MSVQDCQAVGRAETGAVTVGLWPGIRQEDRVWKKVDQPFDLAFNRSTRNVVSWHVRFASTEPEWVT